MIQEQATGSRRDAPRSRQTSEVAAHPAPTIEQIRQRAYEIYLSRKGRPGEPLLDWFQAELELHASATTTRT
jgi:hypothetical protein